ncbi:hypothetical protein Ndes2526B_g01119 [Nannochloris sp. 'desiccata']
MYTFWPLVFFILVACPLVSASWEDCRTTKMVVRNTMIHDNLEVISYQRLGVGQTVADCLTMCRRDQDCYAFNYQKLSKWCYLGTTEESDLVTTKNNKWAAGYRRCVEHTSDDGWSNEGFFGGATGTAPTPVIALNFIDSTIAVNTLQFSFTPPATAGTRDDGSPSVIEKYRVRCMATSGSYPDISKTLTAAEAAVCLAAPATPATSTTGCPIGGLANTTYLCSVVTINTESLESEPASFGPVTVVA